MGFVDAVKAFYGNYAQFGGRASRSEYWWPQLFFILLYVVMFAGSALGETIGGILGVIVGLVILASLIPAIALMVRRLHDTDKSGWFALLSIIPLVSLILLVFFCTKGTAGPNRFGPDPLGGSADVFN